MTKCVRYKNRRQLVNHHACQWRDHHLSTTCVSKTFSLLHYGMFWAVKSTDLFVGEAGGLAETGRRAGRVAPRGLAVRSPGLDEGLCGDGSGGSPGLDEDLPGGVSEGSRWDVFGARAGHHQLPADISPCRRAGLPGESREVCPGTLLPRHGDLLLLLPLSQPAAGEHCGKSPAKSSCTNFFPNNQIYNSAKYK